MAKFLVTTQEQTITKYLVEAEDEAAARAQATWDKELVIESVAQITKGTNVEPYTAPSKIEKVSSIVDANGKKIV